jgi:hypothetical protein
MIPNDDPAARYWSTGITLNWHPRVRRGPNDESVPGWSGTVNFLGDGWFGDNDADSGAVSA